jgi:hypothetical protein
MLKLCEENEIKKKNNVKMNNWLRIKKKKNQVGIRCTDCMIIVHNCLLFYHCHCINSSFSVQRISDLLSMHVFDAKS